MKLHIVGKFLCSTKTNRLIFSRVNLQVAAAMIFASVSSHAVITGPYTVDVNTLHLWHLNESGVPVVDAAPGGTNMMILTNAATLGNASFGGFGTALGTKGTNAPSSAALSPRVLINNAGDEAQITYADAATGAFTVEAIVRVDFDPAMFTSAQPMYFVTAENDSTGGGSRPWQWAILSAGGGNFNMRFFAGGSAAPNNISHSIPTSGPDAIVSNTWYHVAATFSGGAGSSGTLKQYWTLLDPSRTAANQIGSSTMTKLNPLATASVDFCIGNVGRTTPNGGWPGLVD